ncbi:MAG: GTP cyclohydrolase I FolE2 [Nitrososphaerota archaeon]|nr:GTP cyclohydrolase I FolE2 [Nitrososphaerota archaeon]
MTEAEESLPQRASFIDTSADVQLESAHVAVSAGVANLRVLYKDGSISMPVNLSIQTSTGLHRGVHMSRLVKAANGRKAEGMEEWMRWICGEVNRTQPGSEVTCAYELPFGDQFAKVMMRSTERGAITYQFAVGGITACPCSKKMIGVGHMQRAEITLVTKSRKPLDAPATVKKIAECFSASPEEMLKRMDEAEKILEAQDNPRFAEDLVRECVRRFPNALFVRGQCFESIHAHDAVATWSAKPGWMPAI